MIPIDFTPYEWGLIKGAISSSLKLIENTEPIYQHMNDIVTKIDDKMYSLGDNYD